MATIEKNELQCLLKIKDLLAQYLEDCGGCDHSVGICMCDEIWQIEEFSRIVSRLLKDLADELDDPEEEC